MSVTNILRARRVASDEDTAASDETAGLTPRRAQSARSRMRVTPDLLASRRHLLPELEAAVAADALTLHFQTIVALRGPRRAAAASLAPRGIRALALPRWPHPERGLILPQTFMPLATEAGLRDAIGAWSLRAACAAAGRLRAGQVILPLSARYLRDGTLHGMVAAALAQAGLPPERLELAFAETRLIDILRAGGEMEALLSLSALRDLGIGVALDAFGAGPASLSLLRRLPVTALRLAPSMAQLAPLDPHDATILRVAIGAGQALGLRVAATGVETELQRILLQRLGCDEAEGRLFGMPAPIDRLRQLR